MTDAVNVPQQPAGQPTPQTNDEAIGDIARGFLADLDARPDIDEEPEEATPQVETQTDEPQQEAETPPQPEVPMVEVDIDGEKFSIPEKVKHRVMADKDYRQKTQEISATRKQLEQLTAHASQVAQQAQQMAPYYAQLHQMDARVEHLQRALQSPELAADILEFNRAQGELAVLLHHRTQFAQGLQAQSQRLSEQQKAIRSQKLALDAPKLYEAFPELKTPESQQKLTKMLADEGLSDEEIDYISYSTSAVKLAWKAHQYDQMVAEQAKAKAKLKETVKELPAAAQTSRASDNDSATLKRLEKQWKSQGSKWNDPLFTEIRKLQNKVNRK